MGAPGWPLLAAWTPSMASVRTVVIASSGDASSVGKDLLLPGVSS